MFYGIVAAVIVISLLLLVLKLEAQGRRAAQNDQMKRVLDDVHAANMARDSLRRDPAAAKRVRDRFTRGLL